MILVFNHEAIPRTTTREQWREIDRWRRTTQKRLRFLAQERAKNLATLGITDLEYRTRLANEIVNPPVYPPPK